MEALVEALEVSPLRNVLEIGFGCGYSASAIQKYHPLSHTIIDCAPAAIEKAKTWAQIYPRVTIIEGYWQDVLRDKSGFGSERPPVFDRVFFDDFPLALASIESENHTEGETSIAVGDASRDGADSRWGAFLEACTPFLSPGARITGYMARPVDLGKAGDGFDLFLDTIDVEVPPNCPYFTDTKACIPIIQKRLGTD